MTSRSHVTVLLLLLACVSAPRVAAQRPLGPETYRGWGLLTSGLDLVEFGSRPDSAFAPWSAALVPIDLRRYRLDMVLALDQVIGQETTSSVVGRTGALLGVNGGFSVSNDAWNIIHGDPNGFLVIDGRVVSEPYPERPAIAVCNGLDKQYFRIVRPVLRVEVGPFRSVGLNRALGSDDLVLYTPDWNRTTLTPSGSVEVVVRDGRVVSVGHSGSEGIPDNGFVLSGNGLAAHRVDRFVPGDSLSYRLLLSDAGGEALDLTGCDATGAGPLIASGGIVRTDFSGEDYRDGFIFDRHPRTALGWSADGETAYLFVIDGRQEHSAGATLEELAQIMLREGAAFVYNLDGGGSTTMALQGGVVNSPSDGPERRRCDVVVVTPR